jgi:hypothetical protein
MTRDLRELLLEAAPNIALVQISDTQIASRWGLAR